MKQSVSGSSGRGGISNSLKQFFALEASGGIVLFIFAIAALVLANWELSSSWYFGFINTLVNIEVGAWGLQKPMLLLVNDGLMAIFFFVVGLEIKKEILAGELSDSRKASFSVFAAIGGMSVPALIFVVFNTGQASLSGWAIPMATDIAFALGVLSLFGKRVPTSLKVFLLALAIVDDLGAILIIAFFYTSEVAANYLGVAFGVLFLLYLLGLMKLRNWWISLVLGIITWYCFLKSGVHATIAGVLLAFICPASLNPASVQKQRDVSHVDHWIHVLHPWVAFFIMPVFAFFNAGVQISSEAIAALGTSNLAWGIFLGLVLGKPVGVFAFSYLGVKLKMASLPEGVKWSHILGVGFVSGIGFTMSLFIGSLAFDNAQLQDLSKMAILISSLVAMIAGYLLLSLNLNKEEVVENT